MIENLDKLIKELYIGDGQSVLVFELEKKWTCAFHRRPEYDVWGYTCGHDECTHPEHYVILKHGCEVCARSEWVPVEPLKLNTRLTGGLKWQLEQETLLMRYAIEDDLNRTEYGV